MVHNMKNSKEILEAINFLFLNIVELFLVLYKLTCFLFST